MNLHSLQDDLTIEYVVDDNSLIDIDASKIIDHLIEDDETTIGSIAVEIP